MVTLTSSQQTTVNNLVLNFQQALNALIPSMQAGQILDNNLIGYDDWNRICDTLFNIIVVEPIRSSLDESLQLTFDLPAYDTEYESYEDFSLLRISKSEETALAQDNHDDCILLRLIWSGDGDHCFDRVETIRIDSNHKLIDNSFEIRHSDYFTCLVPDGKGYRVIDQISIDLG